MAEWQPIETAPMNQVVLVWIPQKDCDGDVFPVWPAILIPPEDEGDDVWVSVASLDDREDGEVGFSVVSHSPTHWMPLPEPPPQQG